jgi:N-methylhydantoinase A
MSDNVLVLGADIGGTFTDCVALDADGTVFAAKSLSTKANPVDGVLNGFEILAEDMGISVEELLSRADRVAHGTTIGTNMVVERDGARIGLIATRGHGDAILIMNGHGRSAGRAPDEVYSLQETDMPVPIVPRNLIAEVDERVDTNGDTVVALNEDQVRAVVRRLVDEEGVEALAVCFLWSFLNPVHERRVGELIREEAPGVFVSLSSDAAPRMGEFERTVATVINAYVGPKSARYLGEAGDTLEKRGLARPFLVMQTNGGVLPASASAELPFRTIDSGPVGGLAGSAALGRRLGHGHVIATDMGGTSFDVGLVVDGQPLVGDERVIQQYTYRLPHIDVRSIACGGGTIARFDPHTQAMSVGPASAGSEPGPACYGRGGEGATVTDADVVCGLIQPKAFLGGRMPLDEEASRRVVGALADELGLSVDETAAGIIRINNHRAAALIRQQTLERGYDTRDFVIYAYGGAGPVHAFQYAPELGVSEVVVPLGNGASTLSAYGIASTDIVQYEEVETQLRAPFDMAALAEVAGRAEAAATENLVEMGTDAEGATIERWALMRYAEQVMQSVPVPLPDPLEEAADKLAGDFEEEYSRLHGSGARAVFNVIEVFAVRVRMTKPLQQAAEASSAGSDPGEAELEGREVFWPNSMERLRTTVFDGSRLVDGVKIEGPSIVELPHTTVAIAPGQQLRKAGANLILDVGGEVA